MLHGSFWTIKLCKVGSNHHTLIQMLVPWKQWMYCESMQGNRGQHLIDSQGRKNDILVPVFRIADDSNDQALLTCPSEEGLRVWKYVVGRRRPERRIYAPEHLLKCLRIIFIACLKGNIIRKQAISCKPIIIKVLQLLTWKHVTAYLNSWAHKLISIWIFSCLGKCWWCSWSAVTWRTLPIHDHFWSSCTGCNMASS